MAEYIFTYRCRYCGKNFDDIRTGNEPKVFANLINISCGQHADSCYLYNVHLTKDHYGFADLIGCEIKEIRTNDKQ